MRRCVIDGRLQSGTLALRRRRLGTEHNLHGAGGGWRGEGADAGAGVQAVLWAVCAEQVGNRMAGTVNIYKYVLPLAT